MLKWSTRVTTASQPGKILISTEDTSSYQLRPGQSTFRCKKGAPSAKSCKRWEKWTVVTW